MQGPITWTYHKIKEQFNRCTPAQNTEKPISKAQPCPHRSGTDFASKCETCIAEKTTARKYRWKVLLLLLPGFFLSSLDMTVVATALPFIASHFGTCPQMLAEKPTDLDRPIQSAELDCHSLHTDKLCIHTTLWSASRHLRTLCGASVLSVDPYDWKYPLRCCSSMGCPPSRKRSTRRRYRWSG